MAHSLLMDGVFCAQGVCGTSSAAPHWQRLRGEWLDTISSTYMPGRKYTIRLSINVKCYFVYGFKPTQAANLPRDDLAPLMLMIAE